jgi:hypothetical protein
LSVKALVDTGAKKSCIDVNTFNRLRIQCDPVTDDLCCLFGADGQPIKILGTVLADVGIKGLRMPTVFQIMENLTYPLILGIDFLKEHQATIDTHNSIITFYDDLVATPFARKRPHNITYVRSRRSVTIPPLSEAVIQCNIDRHYKLQTSIMEPVDNINNKNIAVARCVVSPSSYIVMCRILNPTSSSVFLKQGFALCTIEPIEINENSSVTSLNDKQSPKLPQTQKSKLKNSNVRSAQEILDEMGLKIDKDKLSDTDYQNLTQFLVTNKDVFASSITDLPGTNRVLHRIETTTNKPIRQRMYRTTPADREEISRQTEEMLKMGVIVPSDSPFSSPVVLVSKSNGQKRFCVDYRRLNDVTEENHHPLPNMTTILDCMAERQPRIFSVLDMRSGFWQVALDPATAYKTAFSTSEGHYEFRRLAFGLRNSPATFQQLMTSVLRHLLFKYALVYIDDILIFSSNMKDHLSHLDEVFKRFREANLKLHPEKCQFAVPEVKYLGHILSDKGVHVDQSKVTAVRDYPRPTNLKQLRGFLGLSGYYRRFIKDYAKTAHPMHQLLKKNAKFDWNEDCENAFNKLKTTLISAPILIFPDFNKDFVLTTDASRTSIGYYLTQKGADGYFHPVGYAGRSLRPNEANYTVSEIELLAILEGCKHFHPFLANRKFTIHCDHVSLKYISSIGAQTGRLGRWAIFLTNYNFDIVYQAGKTNVVADALSRRQYPPEPAKDIEEDFEASLMSLGDLAEEESQSQKTERPKSTVLVEFEYETNQSTVNSVNIIDEQSVVVDFEKEDIVALQRDCPDFKPIFAYLEEGILPDNDKDARKLVIQSEFYNIIDGRLYHTYIPRDPGISKIKPTIHQLCIPRALRQEIVDGFHTNNAHLAFDRLYATVRTRYYWASLHSDLYKFVKSCVDCQASKRSARIRPPLSSLPVKDLLENFHIDILGPLPVTSQGHKYILVIIESFSRWPELVPLRTQRATEVAEALYTFIFTRFGAPLRITSDLGSNFTSNVMKQLCTMFKIKRFTTSSYHPQANAPPEVFNKQILQYFRLYCKDQTEWDKHLPGLLYAYRSTSAVKSIKHSPFMVMFGRDMRLVVDTPLSLAQDLSTDATKYFEDLVERQQLTAKVIEDNIKLSQQRNKAYYDKKSTVPTFQVGQKVWLLSMARKVQVNKKLQRMYTGPYIIVEKGYKNHWFKLRHAVTDKLISNPVYADRLKPFNEPDDVFYTTVEEAKRDALEKKKAQRPLNQIKVPSGQGTHQDSDPDTRPDTGTIPHVTPSTSTSNSDPVQTTSTDIQSQWHPVKRIIGKRGVGKYKRFHVEWDDSKGTKSWVRPEEITPYAKSQYYMEQQSKPKKKKRRFGKY